MAQRLALAISLGLSAACSEERPPEPNFEGPRHVLFISLDTLRADACSLYGYEKETTPFLEELGERGVVFEKHMVNSNNTLTSHATMFTGLLLMSHGADPTKGIGLSTGHETVAERFRDAGFKTAGIAAHEIWLSKNFGLDQGFDMFESAWSNKATTVNEKFVDWIETEKPRRMFAFLHYYDAHSELSGELPYTAPPEYLERFAGTPPEGFDPSMPNPRDPEKTWRLANYLNYFQPAFRSLPEGYAEYMRACYDAGVAKLDDDIRALFGELERLGVLEDTLIVITSDHGEEFEDHGGVLHNGFHDEIMHVPLIIVPPEGTQYPVSRVTQNTRAVDLGPTLLDMLSLPPFDPCQGQSLRPWLEGAELDYAKTFFGKIVVRDQDDKGEFKILGNPDDPHFYDLDADPGELQNIFAKLRAEDPDRILNANKRVQESRRECDLVRNLIGAERQEGAPLNRRQLQELRDLGYIGAADEPGSE